VITTPTRPVVNARESYDSLAPAYDVLTEAYAYEPWLKALEQLASDHGLRGRRTLDIACGTGKSFLPLRSLGYEVTGCDISAGMLDVARRKAPDVRLYEADMRELPCFGSFDLVTCLDDALNYLLEEHELEAAFGGMARNLADDGIAVWDLNTLAQYRGQFASDQITADPDTFIGWRGQRDARAASAGAIVEIVVDVFAHLHGDDWRRSSSVHRQRHWPPSTVRRLAVQAGLQIVDVRGQLPRAVLEDTLDEFVHTKALYVATTRKEST
jgi:SAM-dependent methyltransferase